MKPAPPGPLASYSTCRAMPAQSSAHSQRCSLVSMPTVHAGRQTSLKSVLTSEARLMLRSTMSLGTF